MKEQTVYAEECNRLGRTFPLERRFDKSSSFGM